jgi:O-antigen/teichoic acid export membrane protein
MPDKLKETMFGAVAWSSVDRIGQQAVQFVIGLILARLLSPSDYGLLGMVMIFTALSLVIADGGFGKALIRKKDAGPVDFSSVFYFNILLAAVLYLILYLSLPAIARFFNQPQLIPIGRILFLAIIFNAIYLVPFAKMNKALDYKNIAKVNIGATVGSGLLGVTLALLGKGIWALILQQLVYHFLRMALFYFFSKWKPILRFSFDVIREFWHFSINLLGTSVLNVLFNYLYVIILGKFYPKNEVGYYTQANKLSETIIFTFQSILVSSSYNLFAQIHNETEHLKRIFREVVQKTSFIIFPSLLILMAMAKPLTVVLLTEKWLPSAQYLQMLCVAGLFIPLYNLNITTLDARGKSSLTFRIEFVKKILIVLSIIICFKFGIVPMLAGYAFACFSACLISVLSLKKELGHYIKHQFNDLIKGFLIGGAIALVLSGLSFIIPNLHLLFFVQIMTAVVLYILIIRIFFRERYHETMNFLRNRMTTVSKKQLKK